MKLRRLAHSTRALTLFEVLLVVAIIMLLISLALPMLSGSRRSTRMACVNDLKVVGISFRLWAADNVEKFPMQISTNARGSKEFDTGPFAYRHFRAMSNELNTPKGLFCPNESDRWRSIATVFHPSGAAGEVKFGSNSNLSYFVGLAADSIYPLSILAGDHNLTNGTAIVDYQLNLTTNHPTGWTADMHKLQGNIALADGSVQSLSSSALRNALNYTGIETNRLQMP